MKKYLVAYNTGARIETGIFEVSDGYVPVSDSCLLLKQLVIENKHPNHTEYHDYNGIIGIHTYDDEISVDDLQIIAVSNLGV